MIIKFEGFTEGHKKTIQEEVEIPYGFFVDDMVDVEAIEKALGKALRSSLKESRFIVIRTYRE